MIKFLFLLSFSFINLLAEDSTKTIILPEVEILGYKLSVKKEELPFSIEIINNSKIENYSSSVISKIINGTNGLFLKSYGGSGSIESFSIRGMSSEYIVVLIDGERIPNFQNGIFEMGNILSGNIEKIEILKNGSSSIFGANSVGGVINFVTKRPTKKLNYKISSGIGNFNLFSKSIFVEGGNDLGKMQFEYSNEKSKNNYNFNFNDGINNYLLKREGADYNLNSMTLKVIPELISSDYDFSLFYKSADRGIPTAMTSFEQNSNARINDEEIFVISKFRKNIYDNLLFNYSITGNKKIFKYSDVLVGKKIFESSISNTLANRVELIFNNSEYFSHTFSVDNNIINISGTQIENHKRSQTGINIISTIKNILNYDLILIPSYRKEFYSDTENAESFQIGGNLKILDYPNTRIRINVGKNYRIPTFNDLYWIGSGNKNLKTEKSFQTDFGIISNFDFFGETIFETSIYQIDSKDRILWLPWKNNLWRPENVSKVLSKGIEVNINKSLINNRLFIDLNYSHSIAKRFDEGDVYNKFLPFIPNDLLKFGVTSKIKNFEIILSDSYTGQRFSDDNNNIRSLMNDFNKIDLIAKINFINKNYNYKVIAEVDNLLDEEFEIIKSFPMPKRNFKITISINYN